MKKFLTVLLVIAVMFTFSFGSAFAAGAVVTLADAETAIWAQASADISAFDTVVNSFLANYADNTVTVDFSGNTISFSKTAVETIMAAVKEDVAKVINEAAVVQKALAAADSSIDEDDVTGYKAAIHSAYVTTYGSAALLDTYIEGHTDYHDELLRAEYDVVKAKAEAELAKIVLENYSDTVPAGATTTSKYYINGSDQIYTDGAITSEGYYSFRAQVKAVIEKKQNEFDALDYSASTANNTIAANIKTYNDNQATLLSGLKTLIGTTYAIPTAKEEGWNAEDLDGAKALAISRLETAAAQEKATQKAALQEDIRTLERKDSLTTAEQNTLAQKKEALAAVDGDFAAIVEVETYLVNAMTDKATVNSKNWTSADFEAADKALAVAKVKKVDSLEEEAADLLKVLGLDGAKMYDEAQVNDALETAIDTVYNAGTENAVAAVTLGAMPKQDVVKAEKARVLNNVNKLEFEKVLYPAVNVWEAAATSTNYDYAKLEEVNAAIDAAKAAIRAAKTVEEVDEAFLAGYKAYDAVLTKADRNTAQNKSDYTSAVSAATKEIRAAYASKVALAGGSAAFAETYTLDDSDVTAMIGSAANDEGLYAAYNAEEVKTIAAEIIATINTLKTDKEIAAEASAIAADVVAVKLPVTLADKDTVLSLVDRVNDYKNYMETVGLTYNGTAVREALLDTLLDSVAALEKDEIEKEAKAIKDGGVTLDEEAAVEALQAKVNAFNDAYGQSVGATSNTAPTLDAAVAEVLGTNFVAKKVAKLENDIAKIDPSANPLDVEAIKAAREAYDALGEVTIGDAYYSKLLSLENLVGTDLTDEAAKAYVQDLSIKARSEKTSKGVKVTIKADVQELLDAGYTVEYRFYRSTKSNKNFGKPMIVKSTNTYTNTKGVKGTRYYYKAKLVVKNAAGEVVATTPLTQCLYATRAF